MLPSVNFALHMNRRVSVCCQGKFYRPQVKMGLRTPPVTRHHEGDRPGGNRIRQILTLMLHHLTQRRRPPRMYRPRS
jgi:hypothetical protein